MTPLKPLADDATSISIGKLTVENGTDTVSLYGSLDINRDQQGLAEAKRLKELVDRIVETLEAGSLPAAAPAAAVAKTVRNPFD